MAPDGDGDGDGDSNGDGSGNGNGDGALRDLMAGFYREEMRRALAWRSRLDRTTNWAVVLTAALLTWSFSSRQHPHYVLLIAVLAVLMFLVIEARRYRYYDVFRSRVRLLEEDLFARALDPDEGVQHSRWRELLAADLRQPAFKMGWPEAIQRRLRRVYAFLLAVLGVAWLLRVWARPKAGQSLAQAAAIDGVPGAVVLAAVAVALALVAGWVLWPMRRQAKGEVQEEAGDHRGWKEGS